MVTLLILPRFQTAPKVRPLPSTGVTRLPRYYGPVRHPVRPGLSLTGVRLKVMNLHHTGFPVLRAISTLQTCRRHYPGGIVLDDVVQLHHDGGLP
jgi:hypothetical protein